VHNYVLAIQDDDYEKAYSYLANRSGRPTLSEFRRSLQNDRYGEDVNIRFGATEITSNFATVDLEVIYGSGPFGGEYSFSDTAELLRQAGAWKLTSMPYRLWEYGWY